MKTVSVKRILIFIGIGIAVTVAASTTISLFLSKTVVTEIQDREIKFLFSAIEAGPLAFARLQSASFAQEQLISLMSQPGLLDRGIVAVEIYGGEDFKYKFASWIQNTSNDSGCISSRSRVVEDHASINPFKVILKINNCQVLSETKSIFMYSGYAVLAVVLILLITIIASVWPVATSIHQANLLFSREKPGDNRHISFDPIRELVQKALKTFDLEKKEAVLFMATQVSHDIRSPLSALNIATSNLQGISEERKSLIDNSVKRINDIANELLNNIRRTKEKYLWTTLLSISEEKKMQCQAKGIQFTADIHSGRYFSSPMNDIELGRAISNLIDNSVEACEAAVGKISLSFHPEEESALLIISDNGRGMSREVLSQLGRKGFSYGKADTSSGNGLGVFHAKQLIENSGGSFVVISRVGRGTEIKICIPGKVLS